MTLFLGNVLKCIEQSVLLQTDQKCCGTCGIRIVSTSTSVVLPAKDELKTFHDF